MATAPTWASLSIVMPAYNEVDTIDEAIRASASVLATVADEWEVIVVDDASTDATAARVEALMRTMPSLQLLRCKTILGANAALWRGMQAARGEAVFFIPSDLQIHPDQLPRCLAALATADYVCTIRRPRIDPLHRRLMAWGYNALVRALFPVSVHDVDSSILVRRDVVTALAPTVHSQSDFLPVELVVRAEALGFRVVEVPVAHHARSAGQPTAIHPRAVLGTFRDLWRGYLSLRQLARVGASDVVGRPSP
jgi:glycosyltransferase involved in cell wall biosynthesis